MGLRSGGDGAANREPRITAKRGEPGTSEPWRLEVLNRLAAGDTLDQVSRQLRLDRSLSDKDRAALWLMAWRERRRSTRPSERRTPGEDDGVREPGCARTPAATTATATASGAAGDAPTAAVADARASALAAALALAREETAMDVAALGEIRDGREIVRSLAGDGASFGLKLGASLPIHDTYCERLLQGRISSIVGNAQADQRVNDLRLTRQARIGAYIGVPISTQDARLYVLCCLAHEQRPELCERDVLFMRGLAATIIDAL